jgi:hypothetical protein
LSPINGLDKSNPYNYDTVSSREGENNLILRGSFSIVFEKPGIRCWGLGIRKKLHWF